MKKIYTKVVFDMNTGKTLEEESFDYDGPLALCDGAGDDDDGADGGDGEEGAEGRPDKMEQMFQGLGNSLTKALQDGFAGLSEKLSSNAAPGKRDEDDDDADGDDAGDGLDGIPDDLESLPRRDLLKIIAGVVEKISDKKIKGVRKEIDKTKEMSATQARVNELKELLAEKKDLPEWKKEIRDIMEQFPTISLKRAYNLARSENPEKTAKLKDKYKKADGDESGSDRRYGGMKPKAGKKGAVKSLQGRAASEEAWNMVMGSEGS